MLLYTLAGFRQAPASLRKVSRHKVPAAGMMVSFVAMLGGVLLNYFVPASAFAYITSIATMWAVLGSANLRRGLVPQSLRRTRPVGRALRCGGGAEEALAAEVLNAHQFRTRRAINAVPKVAEPGLEWGGWSRS
jgi:hypothetical protein